MSETNKTSTKQTSNKIARENAKAALATIARPSGRRKRHHYSEADINLRFTSCGRCGVFLTSYRLNHEQEYKEAVKGIDADWLALPWHHDMRELVNKSFGSPIDIESYYLEGSCPGCHRAFCYAEPDPEQPAWFLITL